MLRVTTFNLLAPCYYRIRLPPATSSASALVAPLAQAAAAAAAATAGNGRHANGGQYVLESEDVERFTARNNAIIDMLREMDSDVVCLQEFWFGGGMPQLFKERLHDRYQLVTLKRTNYKEDGIAFLVSHQLDIEDVHQIVFNDVGDRVAALIHLRQSSSAQYLVGNTHLTFPHDDYDVQLRGQQITRFVDAMEDYKRTRFGNNHRAVPTILAGDFNGDSQDFVYKYVTGRHFKSSVFEVLGREMGVTHQTHKGDEVSVDFLFYSTHVKNFKPLTVKIHPPNIADGQWPTSSQFNLSDHRPITVDFAFLETNI